MVLCSFLVFIEGCVDNLLIVFDAVAVAMDDVVRLFSLHACLSPNHHHPDPCHPTYCYFTGRYTNSYPFATKMLPTIGVVCWSQFHTWEERCMKWSSGGTRLGPRISPKQRVPRMLHVLVRMKYDA